MNDTPAAPQGGEQVTGIAAARAALAQQRADGNKTLRGDGLPVTPQQSKGNPSEAGRILAQRAAQAREARQAETARQAQEAERISQAQAQETEEADQQAANTSGEETDGLEKSDHLQSDDAEGAEGETEQHSEDDFEQAAIDLGEGVSLTRAEIKQNILRQADYTRKTQALAEETKAFESDRSERLSVLETLERHLASQLGEMKSLKALVTEFGAEEGLLMYGEQQERMEQLQTAQHVRAQEQAHHIAKLRDSTLKALAEKHGDKAPSYFNDAVEYLHGFMGGDKDALASSVTHPVAIELLHKAKQWDNLQASQKSVKRTVAGKPAVVKPGTKVSAQAGASSKLQNAVAALKASGSIADAKAVLQARRGLQRR